jgi:hypothetical protein
MLHWKSLAGAVAGILIVLAPATALAQAASAGRAQVLDLLERDTLVTDKSDKSGRATAGVLRLFLADPELGLVGMYREGDSVLFFETLPVVMPVVAADEAVEEGQADAMVKLSEPSTLLAARFVREDGRTVAIAGSTAAPQSWHQEKSESSDTATTRKDKARRDDSLRMATLATNALQAHLHDTLYAGDVALLSRLAEQAPAALKAGDVVAADEMTIVDSDERTALAGLQWAEHAHRSFRLNKSGRDMIDVELAGTRAEAMQVDQEDEPGEFRVEVYARLANLDGRTVVAQVGGHLDPDGWFGSFTEVAMEWGPQTILLDDTVGHADPIEDLIASVRDGANAVAAAQIARSGSLDMLPYWAVDAWAGSASGLRELLLPMRDDREQEEVRAKSTYTYYNKLHVHDKALAVILRHSASVIRNYRKTNSSGAVSLSSTYNFCNEGTCATSMSVKCGPVTSTNSSTGWKMPPVRTSHVDDPGGGVRHSCGTRYSMAFKSNHHNCHSDTWTQVRAVKGLSHGAFSGKCLEPKEIAAHCNH